MEIIEGNNDFEKLIKENVLVDFYASWCGPCRMIAPILEELKDKVQIIKIDVDKNEEICKKYGVMSIPTLIYFKNINEYNVYTGFMPKEEILNFIDKK